MTDADERVSGARLWEAPCWARGDGGSCRKWPGAAATLREEGQEEAYADCRAGTCQLRPGGGGRCHISGIPGGCLCPGRIRASGRSAGRLAAGDWVPAVGPWAAGMHAASRSGPEKASCPTWLSPLTGRTTPGWPPGHTGAPARGGPQVSARGCAPWPVRLEL